jgi:type IV pilus assembly protein PilW
MIELMVGLAVGLFLMAGIVQLLVSSGASYQAEENFARLQENGRYAIQAISRDARMSRNLGCRSLLMDEVLETLNVVACDLFVGTWSADGASCAGATFLDSNQPFGFDAGFSGGPQQNGAWATLPDTVENTNWVRGDVLMLWGATGPGSYVSEAFTAARDEDVRLAAANDALNNAGDLAVITDCAGTDVFEISGPETVTTTLEHADTAGVNAGAKFSRAYNYAGDSLVAGTHNRSMVFPFAFRIYYVCCMDSNTGNLAGNAASCRVPSTRFRPTLCEWSAARGDSQQLVTDIADMRVTYIVDTDGDGIPDLYPSEDASTAQDITAGGDWPNVFGAQIELLAATADEVRKEDASPWDDDWPGAGGDRLGEGLADDGKQYSRFVTTVAFRALTPWYLKK